MLAHQALVELTRIDPRQGQIVKLRYLGGEPRPSGTMTPQRSVASKLISAAGVIAAIVAAIAITWSVKPALPPGDELRLEIATPTTTTPASMAISPDGHAVVRATEQLRV